MTSRRAAYIGPIGGVRSPPAVVRAAVSNTPEPHPHVRVPWQLCELVDRADDEGRKQSINVLVNGHDRDALAGRIDLSELAAFVRAVGHVALAGIEASVIGIVRT